jgi:hypothetical protein
MSYNNVVEYLESVGKAIDINANPHDGRVSFILPARVIEMGRLNDGTFAIHIHAGMMTKIMAEMMEHLEGKGMDEILKESAMTIIMGDQT